MNYGEQAYDAYRKHLPGQLMWSELTDGQRSAWNIAASWVVGLCIEKGVHESRLKHRIEVLQVQNAELVAALKRLVDRDLSYFNGYVSEGVISRADVEAGRKALRAKGDT